MHSHISKTTFLIRFNLVQVCPSACFLYIPSSDVLNRVILLLTVALNLVVVRDRAPNISISTQQNHGYFTESFYNIALQIFCLV